MAFYQVSMFGLNKAMEHRKCSVANVALLLLEGSQIFISESSFYRILHERGLLERVEHDLVLAADTIMREGFMNRWIILHQEMYI